MSVSRRQRGLTLVELVIFIVIVGVAVVGILQVIALNTSHSADPVRRKQAMAIAEGLLEEVRLAQLTWCDGDDPNVEEAEDASQCTVAEGVGAEPGNTRPFDNINDYVAAYGAPEEFDKDVVGNTFPSGYKATVTVNQHTTLGTAGTPVPAAAPVPAEAALLITVAVSYGTEQVVLESIRTRFTPRNLSIIPPALSP